MLLMGLLLIPGLPGGGANPDERIAYVAHHPWLWRLGWLPWQLSALFDLLTGVALVGTAWVPRLPALLTLLVTLVAVAFDQWGEGLWTISGPDLAALALNASDPSIYLTFEAEVYRLTVAWGASLYLLMALGWTWCFAAAGTWSRGLTVLSTVTWSSLAAGSAVLLLPDAWRPASAVITAANGIGFLLLLAWFAWVTELVLRRSRPNTSHGRLAPWRHPWRGPVGRMLDTLANGRLARAYCEWMPPVSFLSDITDVIYCNYLVEASQVESLVPVGLELQRLGPDGRYALFTFLTYRHGHFGPALLGPLRRLLPSPVHSNWRIHVRHASTGREGIYFVTNAIDSTPHALAARLLSEGMPMHVLQRAAVSRESAGHFEVLLDPGPGSAPDAKAELSPGPAELPPNWAECFSSFEAFLAYCVPQDRAFSAQPWYDRITRQEIHLGIPLSSCEPLRGVVRSRAAAAIVGDAPAVCFRVARVAFRFDREQYDRLTS
jgi:hypothetical protein